jgi:hypothetical protein
MRGEGGKVGSRAGGNDSGDPAPRPVELASGCCISAGRTERSLRERPRPPSRTAPHRRRTPSATASGPTRRAARQQSGEHRVRRTGQPAWIEAAVQQAWRERCRDCLDPDRLARRGRHRLPYRRGRQCRTIAEPHRKHRGRLDRWRRRRQGQYVAHVCAKNAVGAQPGDRATQGRVEIAQSAARARPADLVLEDASARDCNLDSHRVAGRDVDADTPPHADRRRVVGPTVHRRHPVLPVSRCGPMSLIS